MVRFILVVGLALLTLRDAASQDTEPATPTPSPQPTSATSSAQEATSPAPSPEPSAPALLPESGQLPAPSPTPPAAPRRPYDLIPEGARPAPAPLFQNKPSAAQQLADRIRFRQLRTIAQNDPYSIQLWLMAKQACTLDGLREYLRAYYHYLGARMRALEPRLKAMIDAYEAARVASAIQVNIRPTIPLRDLPRAARAGANQGAQ